jgi:hypothetical protein
MGGIWIRSQDKGLYFCKGFDAPQLKNYATDKNKVYAIAGYVSGEMQPILGWYATKERALQVLDEIQEYIACGTTKAHEGETGTWRKVEKYGVVYIMPES